MSKDDPKVSRKAYELWESEGRPHGRDQDHWHRARAEVEADDGKPKPKRAPRKAAAKPAQGTGDKVKAETPAKATGKTKAPAAKKPAARKPAGKKD